MRMLAHGLFAAIALAATVPPLHASEAAATIGDAVITKAELERAAQARLLRIRTEAYEARRAAIDKRVDEILLLRRAAKEQLPASDWLAREVAKRVPAGTDSGAAYETLSAEERTARDTRDALRLQAEGEILRELRAAAKVDLRLEPPRLDRRDLGGAIVHGPDDAPVTMVVFQDFQCPRCASLVPVFQVLREQYPDTLRILHRDFTLANHPQAKAAAEAAGCAAEQHKFWEMADALYANQESLFRATFEQLATNSGLDRAKLIECLDSGRQKEAWKSGVATARELGLRGTPVMLINGRLVAGVREIEEYMRIVDEELGKSSMGDG